MPYYIAITGASGSGKTTILSILNKMGCFTKDYDKYSIDVILYSTCVQLKLKQMIDNEIILIKQVDLKKIGDYFETHRNEELLFENWYQPILGNYIKQDIISNSYGGLCFFDIPFLSKKQIIELFQEVWFVQSDFEICCERIIKRNGYSYEKSRYLVKRSFENIDNLTSDVIIIDNNQGIKELETSIRKRVFYLTDRGD